MRTDAVFVVVLAGAALTTALLIETSAPADAFADGRRAEVRDTGTTELRMPADEAPPRLVSREEWAAELAKGRAS